MPIVADASPLILLAKTRQLDLLHLLYDEVLLPTAVWDEIVVREGRRSGAAAIAAATWMHRVDGGPPAPLAGMGHLGAGEVAVLSVASQRSPPLKALVDDQDARQAAARLGVPVTGTGGVLVLAKQSGLVRLVRPRFQQLLDAGWFVSNAVLDTLLESAGEA